MKGEVFHMCSMIASAKNALHTKTFIQYEPLGYELNTVFRFLPEREGETGEIAEDVESWYAKCMYNGMEDVKLLVPIQVKDKKRLGFINTTGNIMLCFYPGEKLSVWLPHWASDKEKKGWNIMYQETRWDNHPEGKPQYQDNTQELKKVLQDISKFSEEIGCPGWSEVFRRSLKMLEGDFDYTADDERMLEELKKKGRILPPKRHLALPKPYIDIFEAASNAEVFGGMGSWNDLPAGMAGEKSREADYNELSDRLYKEVMRSVMYAMNEW